MNWLFLSTNWLEKIRISNTPTQQHTPAIAYKLTHTLRHSDKNYVSQTQSLEFSNPSNSPPLPPLHQRTSPGSRWAVSCAWNPSARNDTSWASAIQGPAARRVRGCHSALSFRPLPPSPPLPSVCEPLYPSPLPCDFFVPNGGLGWWGFQDVEKCLSIGDSIFL